jgi:hypothetical protein
MTSISAAAEAFLSAVQTQTHERQPSPVAYRADGDLRDVQLVGQIDVHAAMSAAIFALRESSEEMEEAASAYVEQSQHVAVDGVWSVMIDALLADRT